MLFALHCSQTPAIFFHAIGYLFMWQSVAMDVLFKRLNYWEELEGNSLILI